LSNKWKTKTVPIEDIAPTEVNANRMDEASFQRLVDNISKSGLSSSIACYKRTDDGKYVIISGNHRYKACVSLGYSTLTIIYADEEDMTKDEILAVQLSHNSLHGSDDKGILRKLFDEIESIDFKEFSNISVDDFKPISIDSVSIVPLSEHYRVGLILYKRDMEALAELFDLVEEELAISETVFLADGETLTDDFITAMTEVKKQYAIKSTSIAFSKILELAASAIKTKVTS